ncbi:MAG: HAMP domain-containing histidine kinase [Clostridiales bacterium]|nr:HAMP domain-containing histidine kinase [Clostridiales bacterium]
MKRKRGRVPEMQGLKRRLMGRMLGMLAAFAAAFFLLIYFIAGGPMRWLVGLIYAVFPQVRRLEGVYDTVTDNLPLFLLILGVLGVLALLWLYAGWMGRYFDYINRGMDQLAAASAEEILLPGELSMVSRKMNQVKHSLEQKTRQAAEAEQRKNDLVVYLAHDIRTPLTSVLGYLALLQEAEDMPAAQRAKYVGITLEKARRLEQLIDEFFDITRFNLQSIVLEREPLNLCLLCQQAAEQFYPVLEQQRKGMQIRVSEELTVWADADKLARVVTNVLKNAIAYSFEGSNILLEARAAGDQVRISVANRGPEIPQEKLDTIFEKFYRLDASRSSQSGGAGLGLAIAKEIVTAHGGEIGVTSEEGVTRFWIALPVHQAP